MINKEKNNRNQKGMMSGSSLKFHGGKRFQADTRKKQQKSGSLLATSSSRKEDWCKDDGSGEIVARRD